MRKQKQNCPMSILYGTTDVRSFTHPSPTPTSARQAPKRNIPQAVFDSADAKRIIAAGHAKACAELAHTPRHQLGEDNPNHPMYDSRS